MDFSFVRHNDEDYGLKEVLFDTRLPKCTPEVMDDNWSSSADDILDSMFSMDFLNNLNDHQNGFGTFGDFSEQIKMEAEDYEITVPSLPEPLLSQENNAISSNSSDSGLSSDNLEVEMSPPYEPLSPASPNLSISEKESSSTPAAVKTVELSQLKSMIASNNEQKPKVIVQKVPQVMTLTNTVQTNSNTIQPQKPQQQTYRQCFKQRSVVNGVRGNEIKIVKLSPQMYTASNNKPVTIQVKNSNSGAKIQAKPGTLFLNKAKLTEMKKMVRLPNSNPRSILIPVSVQDGMKEVKTFKIINTTAVRAAAAKVNESVTEANHNFQVKQIGKQKIFPSVSPNIEAQEDAFIEHSSDSESIIIEDGYDNDEYVHDPEVPYPKLALTSEEKRLLSKEGITLPTHYPLTKHEERELKRIRRKIRNKISAQDSRKRKKEYVDGLEERVKQCTEENLTLIKRIKQLQNQNQNLTSQMKKLQTLLTKGTNKTTQPTTCLMVLLLSLALVAAPNLKLGQNSKEGDLEEAVQNTILQNRRNLLFNNKDQSTDIFDEEVNMSDIVSAVEFNNERESATTVCKTESNTYTSAALGEPKCKKMKLTPTDFIDEVDDENWYLSKNKLHKTSIENSGEILPEQLQTSGFNIQNGNTAAENDQQAWLDKDILEMVSPTVNGLYELNMDKLTEGTMIDVTPKQIYANQANTKQNSSEMRQIEKY